jgi:AmmeMemoRadiSam system protein A
VTPSLSTSDGHALLRLARAAIEDRLFGGGALASARAALALTPALSAKRGAFVTLKTPEAEGGYRLRGCIGSVVPVEPADQAVVTAARAAAFDDPRFPALTAKEYPSIRISVSLLTAIEPVGSASEIVPGEHGVVLDARGRRALFLPKVAAEQGWSTPEILENLARKAGLEKGAWREGALSVFRSEDFAEE